MPDDKKETTDFFGGSDLPAELKLAKDFVLDETNPNDLRVRLMHQAFKDKTGIIVFYQPNCPACQAFKPTIVKLAEASKGYFPVGTINCIDYKNGNELLSEYVKVNSVPNIKFHKNGQFFDYVGGDRQVPSILRKLCEMEGICNDGIAAAVGMSPQQFFGGSEWWG